MRKLRIIILFLAIFYEMLGFGISYGSNLVPVKKEVRFLYNGKITKSSNAVFYLNNCLYIFLKNYLKGINYNMKKSSYNKNVFEMSNGKNKIMLRINNNFVYKNGKAIKWKNTPMLYRGNIYVPVKDFSDLIDKKYILDAGSSAEDDNSKKVIMQIMICDNNQYKLIKSIIDKANKIISTCKCYKMYRFEQINDETYMDIDNTSKSLYYEDYIHKKHNSLYFYIKGHGYVSLAKCSSKGKYLGNEAWLEDSIDEAFFSDEKVAGDQLYPFIKNTDFISAGLKRISKSNEIILEGDVINSIYSDYNPKYQAHTRIVIDKKTNTFKECTAGLIKANEKWGFNGAKFSEIYWKEEISKVNGNIKIKIPAGVKKLINND